jgi:hypothetical protein
MGEEHTPAEREASIESAHEQPHAPAPKEIGGPGGLEPTRYGDWERNGRCFDF